MKAFLLILSMGWCLQAFSQQEYFVFLQTENHQPFYVRLGERNYSSSLSGYLILSKLKDSSYSFAVGFPQNQMPEQTFSVIVKKDRGFEIKNLGSQGWALFDLQSLQLINAIKPAGTGSGGAAYNLIKKEDDFARLMAGVVNDTAVMYTVVAIEPKKPEPKKEDTAIVKREEVKKPDIVTEVKKEDSAVVVKNEEPKKEELIVKTDTVAKVPEPKKEELIIKTDTVAKVPEPKKEELIVKTDTVAKQPEQDPMNDSVFNPPALPVIHVVNQFKSDSGYHITYVDDSKDSIHIFIPIEHEIAVVKDTSTTKVTPPATETITDTSKSTSKLFMNNSDCRNFATTNDVDKLRVKLLGEKDSESRIAAAKKAFRLKCYSALQIKALSEMFPIDEQKYKFFEAAYPFVSDTGNFKSLVSLFTDPDYAQRFRKLVRLD